MTVRIAVRRVKMKLENIDDVLKQNMSKDCSTHFLESCIIDCVDY